ncbi:TetR/AcrR family transcriptional regulator [Natrarchaeobius chitinivorans]|uniref:TetR/AcrR family transcriptional regulator n=1 Tax=Natrarchaeobius chitinivorans TaxID=1679083 RepID=A0A3N6MYV3_NATCH|nr:TetR/AcrR family transcriptional regulator [Natrarchaeobius chitinivorans]RQG90762.1 TetR/AcrR family transcriptional regulator [Natrarchaeobius chitinivorans]
MKGFSDEERDLIRTNLLEEGRDLFAQFGLERTRIKDVTEAVGIGTSTFYQFFDSKEKLYAEVLMRERARLDAEIAEAASNAETPREEIRVTLERTFDAIESNPLIFRLIVEGELRSLQNHLSEAERKALSEQVWTTNMSAIDQWADRSALRERDPQTLNAFLLTLVFVTRSKDVFSSNEVGPEYDEIRDLLIDVVVDGLFQHH